MGSEKGRCAKMVQPMGQSLHLSLNRSKVGPMKKSSLTVIVMTVSLLFGSGIPQAAETRVYIQFSVGGAVMVGGGILWWGITQRTRVSRNLQASAPLDPHPFFFDDKTNGITSLSFHQRERVQKEGGNPFHAPPMPFQIPLFVYRW